MPQALKIADAKAAVEKELETLEKIPAWQLTKVRNQKEVKKQGIMEEKFILSHRCICVISRIRSWNLNDRRGDTVKDDSGSYVVIY